MPLDSNSKYELISTSESFRDLRHLSDDKTVLENPHKGWYYHLVDNSLKSSLYRKDIEPHRFKTPGMHHMYLRFDWGDIEARGEGIYDWSELDRIMDEWGKFGYKFTLRICTFEPVGATIYATPKWVFDMGASFTEVSNGELVGYEPDYNDPIYLEKLDNFLAECARKFDNDPRIEYIDIGSFGTWGEGHTYAGSGKTFSTETVMAHINLHLKNFKNKQLVLNDDYIEAGYKNSPQDASFIYDYTLSKGLGLRDDSICVDGYVKLFGYDSLRRPSIFKEYAKNAPVDIELAHIYHQIPERFRDGLTALDAIKRAHATYAGFHGYEAEWLAKAEYLTEYLANRLGYWFFIDGVDMGYPTSGTYEIAKILISNKGYSKCYHQYDLKLRARSRDGSLYSLNSDYPDSTRWESDTVSEEAVKLDFTGVPAGKYTLDVGLFLGETPIKLGINASLKTDDGFYGLFEFTVNEL